MIETDMSWLASVYWSPGWVPTEPKLDFVIDNSSAPGSLAAAGAAITPVSSRTATPQFSARMTSPHRQPNELEGLALHAPQLIPEAPSDPVGTLTIRATTALTLSR